MKSAPRTAPVDPFEEVTRYEFAVRAVLDGLRASIKAKYHDLNEHQIMLLGAIRDGETMGDATQRQAVAVTNLSSMVGKLADAGYITIETDRDRRRRIVRRTAKGRAVAAHAKAEIDVLYKKHIAPLRRS